MKQFGQDQSAAAAITSTANPSSEYLAYVQAKKTDSVSAETFIATDGKMKRINDVITQIANTNVPVLITGESGTGKEIIAKKIHQTSNRNVKPFVAINCAALPANLLESELFGYEKGAFTGAHQRHLGKFEQANGGTLLLDEVTEMDPALQAKLLRALQERQVERIGGSGPVAVDTRIIATTNRDVVKAVAEGRFRQDLYYRLYVVQIEVPALRERTSDIVPLAQHFLKKFDEQYSKTLHTFSTEAMDKLQRYNWPGNVRELENLMQRTVLMAASDVVTAGDIPIESQLSGGSMDWVSALPIGRALRDVETQFILETIKHHEGNRTHAARTLGISLRTLRNKINEFSAEGFDVMAPTLGRAQ